MILRMIRDVEGASMIYNIDMEPCMIVMLFNDGDIDP